MLGRRCPLPIVYLLVALPAGSGSMGPSIKFYWTAHRCSAKTWSAGLLCWNEVGFLRKRRPFLRLELFLIIVIFLIRLSFTRDEWSWEFRLLDRSWTRMVLLAVSPVDDLFFLIVSCFCQLAFACWNPAGLCWSSRFLVRSCCSQCCFRTTAKGSPRTLVGEGMWVNAKDSAFLLASHLHCSLRFGFSPRDGRGWYPPL